ncbi:MAG: slipin family protein [Candidatus Micrarchaeota archaeon]|nr:slipin family protein [Candidatus Micrarchaeota archaeon]
MVFELMLCSWVAVIALVAFILLSVRIVNEYERGVLFTFGKFSGIMGPGIHIVIPIIQSWERVDIRVNVIDVPKQDTMTKDNVSVVINAVIYFRIADPKASVIEVENIYSATSQLAQTTMRNVVGEITLDELLTKRDETAKKIRKIVDDATDAWGVKVEAVELKDIELPPDLVRVIAKEAEAEREKRAIIIKAEGEVQAAKSFVKAAKELSKIDGALHIRTLQTINNLGNEKSITKVYALPYELLRDLESFLKNFKK